MDKVKYLIIGNGIAGLAAAREIRSNDEKGTITMVSSESSLTYYRVKLTEYISKDFIDEDLLVSKENWYNDKGIQVILRKIVENIDIDKNTIRLDDGREISYEKLLIATGSRPFIPPINGKYKKGVFALRTLRDLHYLKDYLQSCNDVTIVGGGLLGLEAAWSTKQLDKQVNVIQSGPYLLNKQLDEEIARKLEAKLTQAGIKIYLNSRAQEILGEDTATGLKLNEDNEIATDAVLFSAGVRSNLDLVIDTDIANDRGIKVDNYMKTNIDNIYAAGDVAEVSGMVLGLWTAGNEQGKIAGANMSGKQLAYDQPKIFTNLQIGDIKIFSAGDIEDFDKVYEYKDNDNDIHHKLFTKNGKIIGVILFGDLKDMNSLRNAVISKLDIKEYIKGDNRFK